MVLVRYPQGAQLFCQGDPGNALYLIRSGRICVVKDSTPQEEKKKLAYLGRGESLGEMALLTGEPRSATARADTPTEVLVLQKKDFDFLIKDFPSMALHLSRVLSKRLALTSQEQEKVHPSEILVLLTATSPEDKILFCSNLALSLVEQTRRRVLLLEVSAGESLFGPPLRLTPFQNHESRLRPEDFQNFESMRRGLITHPSGLELLHLDEGLLNEISLDVLPSFLSQLKEHFDLVLLSLPNQPSKASWEILKESDRVVFTIDPHYKVHSDSFLKDVKRKIPGKKLFLVRLQLEDVPATRTSMEEFYLPWRSTLRTEFLKNKSPYLNHYPAGQKFLDRLARILGHIRIGLAMGSGAAYGYILIGILKVLEREGIFPDVISGTSMGALIGSFYASGKSPEELENFALSISKEKLLRMALVDFNIPRRGYPGVLIGRSILKLLKSVLGNMTFEQLKIPFACVATDITTGEEVILKDGKVAEAVRASVSLPFFFQPHYLNGRYLVDGGLVNPVPTSVIASMGANILISVNLTTKPFHKRIPSLHGWQRTALSPLREPNLLEVLLKTIYTMQFEIAHARAEIAHVVLSPDTSRFTWTDFHRARDIIRLGEEATEESISQIKSLLPFFADYCKVPTHIPTTRYY